MNIQKSKSNGYRGYIFSRTINGNLIPQKVQNLVIRDYAKRKNLFLKLSAVEYTFKNSYLMLNSVLKSLNVLNGIVFYSLNMLPKEKNKRKKIFNMFINKKKELHFALEEIILRDHKSSILVEDIFFVDMNSKRKVKF